MHTCTQWVCVYVCVRGSVPLLPRLVLWPFLYASSLLTFHMQMNVYTGCTRIHRYMQRQGHTRLSRQAKHSLKAVHGKGT